MIGCAIREHYCCKSINAKLWADYTPAGQVEDTRLHGRVDRDVLELHGSGHYGTGLSEAKVSEWVSRRFPDAQGHL